MRTAIYVLLLAAVVYLAWSLYDPFDPKDLKDKRVVVCGASTGIGEEIAYLYARMGARIVITSRRQTVLEKVKAKCVELGAAQVEIFAGDLSVKNVSRDLINFSAEKLGGIDHLILNHIISYYTEWRSTSDLDRAAKLMQVNFISYVNLATFAMPSLEESHGSIAVVSSAMGLYPTPHTHVYAASKHALHGFFHSMRLDLMLYNSNISISVIPLGLFRTDNAVANTLTKLPDLFKIWGEPADAAYSIARAAQLKLREVCYPWFAVKLVDIFYMLFPSAMDSFFVMTFKDTIDP